MQKTNALGGSTLLNTLRGKWTAKELEDLVAVREDLGLEVPGALALPVYRQFAFYYAAERPD